MTNLIRLCAAAFAIFATPVLADPAEVVGIEIRQTSDGWRFDVAIAHGDTGWDDYADGWRIETPTGEILGERPLAHPHVDEQPFTRALSRVEIPATTTQIMVRASTNVDGYADTAFGPFDLPNPD